jgi:tRNA (guanine-N1)-methyltransferase
MQFDIITLFPKIIDTYANQGVIGKAVKNEKLQIITHDLREHGQGAYKQVDDRPFGGGSGMVLMFEPINKALEQIKAQYKKDKISKFTYKQSIAKEFVQDHQANNLQALVIICGRYEGFDQRILDELVDLEISIGNYVLSGGELPALIMIDSIGRLIPGVLGKEESFEHDSFYKDDKLLQYPQYTRPEVIEYQSKKLAVPKVLLSGDHEEIKKWRENLSPTRTP